MRLRKATSYGILSVAQVAAGNRKGPMPAWKVAKGIGVPPERLSNCLPLLTRLRVLRSDRGPSSDRGLYLAKPAAEMTLLEIIEAIDGPVTGGLDAPRSAKFPPKARNKIERLLADLNDYRRAKLEACTVKQFMP